jgi:uncharacterized protein (TIGR01777 family)
MSRTIVLTGATGLIGKRIFAELSARGDRVILLVRNAEKSAPLFPAGTEIVSWDFKSPAPVLVSTLSSADGIIHLAGENIFSRRWSDEHKKKVYDSRIISTRIVTEAILNSTRRQGVFISASAVGYYGINPKSSVTESSLNDDDFLASLTKDWELASAPLEKNGIRVARIRTGIVLDTKEGALAKMLLPFKLFIGGPLGNGKQPFPWIHIDDIASLFIYALDNDSMTGAYNGAAPQTISMKEFCKVLGKEMSRPSFMNVPPFALRLLYGEGAEYLLNGADVIPMRTLDSGYKFRFEKIDAALKNLV